jgi:putative endonuclease
MNAEVNQNHGSGNFYQSPRQKASKKFEAFFMFRVYIIHSISCNKYYTGHTQDLDNRLNEHNSEETKSIQGCSPWILVWQREVESRGEANKIKKRGAGRFLRDLNIFQGSLVLRGALRAKVVSSKLATPT